MVGEILSRFVHCLYNGVEGDHSRSREEVGEGEGIDGSHCRHRISLDAGDLHKSADGVAGKTEMVLKGELSRIFDLVDAHFKELGESRRRHSAGCTHLCLTAAFRARDGSVLLDEISDKSARGESSYDLLVGEALLFLHIAEHRGYNGAGAAGGGGNDFAAVGILLADRKGIRADDAVFSGLRAFVDMALIEKMLSFSFNIKSARQCSRSNKTLSDSGLHGFPHLI